MVHLLPCAVRRTDRVLLGDLRRRRHARSNVLQPRAAVAARADYEHAAIMRGDTWRGTFGRYEPALWWRT
jgi:hypothetical protein